MTEIDRICKLVMECVECIVYNNYTRLEELGALTEVSESDIKRVLAEYNRSEHPVMPPDGFFEKVEGFYAGRDIHIGKYNDGSGYYVDIDLWYAAGQSDLTLQLDILKKDHKLAVTITDLHVL